jgi:hypothetical protein
MHVANSKRRINVQVTALLLIACASLHFLRVADAMILKLDSSRIIQNKILYEYMRFSQYKGWCNRNSMLNI